MGALEENNGKREDYEDKSTDQSPSISATLSRKETFLQRTRQIAKNKNEIRTQIFEHVGITGNKAPSENPDGYEAQVGREAARLQERYSVNTLEKMLKGSIQRGEFGEEAQSNGKLPRSMAFADDTDICRKLRRKMRDSQSDPEFLRAHAEAVFRAYCGQLQAQRINDKGLG